MMFVYETADGNVERGQRSEEYAHGFIDGYKQACEATLNEPEETEELCPWDCVCSFGKSQKEPVVEEDIDDTDDIKNIGGLLVCNIKEELERRFSDYAEVTDKIEIAEAQAEIDAGIEYVFNLFLKMLDGRAE